MSDIHILYTSYIGIGIRFVLCTLKSDTGLSMLLRNASSSKTSDF